MLRLAETERLVESLESIMQSVLPLVEGGELLRTEAGLLAIEGAMRRSELTALRAQAAEAELDIRRLMGLSPVAEVDMIAAIPALSTPQEAVGQLADTNLTLARLRSEYEVAEVTLRREIRKQYPDLVIGPQVESDEGQSRIGIVGAIPIPMLNANREGIATATAEREVARGAYETAYEDAVGKVAGLQVRAEAAHQQRRELEQTLVPMVDRQVADIRRLIELGESGGVGGLVLLESLVRAHGVKMRLIDLSLDAALAEIKMRELIGPDQPKAPETAAARDADGPASPDAAEVSR
jgi:outer membrane protein TolC